MQDALLRRLEQDPVGADVLDASWEELDFAFVPEGAFRRITARLAAAETVRSSGVRDTRRTRTWNRRSGLMLSIIKGRDNKQILNRADLPPEYAEFRVAAYNSMVTGKHARNGLAVVAAKVDLDTMARHAMIRLTFKLGG